MLLSENTLAVLKNFTTINTSMFFRTGNLLRTMNREKSILAEAIIDEEITTDFGIYELNQLLAILSLHKASPELTIKGNNLVIQGGRSTIVYRCTSEENLKGIPEKDKKASLPSEDISFILTEDDFNWVMRSSSVLKSPNIAIVGENGKVFINTYDSANDSEAADSLEVATYTGAPVFFLFKTENWKMLPGTYKVTVSSKGVSSFEHQSRKITYWVALDAKTK